MFGHIPASVTGPVPVVVCGAKRDSKLDSKRDMPQRPSAARAGMPQLPLSPNSPQYGLFAPSLSGDVSTVQRELIAVRVVSSFSNSCRPLGLGVDSSGNALVAHSSFKHMQLTHVTMPLRHAFTPYGYRIEADQLPPSTPNKLVNPRGLTFVDPVLTTAVLQRAAAAAAAGGDSKSSPAVAGRSLHPFQWGAVPTPSSAAGGAAGGFGGAPPRTPSLANGMVSPGPGAATPSALGSLPSSLPPYAAYVIDDTQLALFTAPFGGRSTITPVLQFSELPAPAILRAAGTGAGAAAGASANGSTPNAGGPPTPFARSGTQNRLVGVGSNNPFPPSLPSPSTAAVPSPAFGNRPMTATAATVFDRVSWAKEAIAGLAVRRRPRVFASRVGHSRSNSADASITSGSGTGTGIGVGDLFFTCQGRCRIYCRHAASGQVTAFAGTGESGYRDGSAAGARFEAPASIAFDSTEKRMFVADKTRVRVINMEDNTVSTYAGPGARVFSKDASQTVPVPFEWAVGLAIDAHDRVYVADPEAGQIRVLFPPTASQIAAATSAFAELAKENAAAAAAAAAEQKASATPPTGSRPPPAMLGRGNSSANLVAGGADRRPGMLSRGGGEGASGAAAASSGATSGSNGSPSKPPIALLKRGDSSANLAGGRPGAAVKHGASLRNLLIGTIDLDAEDKPAPNVFSGLVSPKNAGVANANAAVAANKADSGAGAGGAAGGKYLVRSGSQRNVLPAATGSQPPAAASSGSRFAAESNATNSPSRRARTLLPVAGSTGIGGTATSGTALSASAVTVLSFTLPSEAGHAATADPKPFHPVLLSIDPTTGFLWYSDNSLYRIAPVDYPADWPEDPTGGWVLKTKTIYLHESTGFTSPSAPSGVLPRPLKGELHHPSVDELCRGRSPKIQAELKTEDAIERAAARYPLDSGWYEMTLANGHDIWYWDSVHGTAQWSRPISSSVRRKLTHDQEARDKLTRQKREPFQSVIVDVDDYFSLTRDSSLIAQPRGLCYSADGRTLVCVGANGVTIIPVAESDEKTGGGGQQQKPISINTAELKQATGVVWHPEFGILIANPGRSTIQRLEKGVCRTFAGRDGVGGSADGPIATATFRRPCALAIDDLNRILVVDSNTNKIRLIDPQQKCVTTFAGTGAEGGGDGPALTAQFAMPKGIAVDRRNGHIYVSEFMGNRIRRIVNGVVSLYAGTGQPGSSDGPLLAAKFNGPTALAFDEFHDRLFVLDTESGDVRCIVMDSFATPAGQPSPTATAIAAEYAMTDSGRQIQTSAGRQLATSAGMRPGTAAYGAGGGGGPLPLPNPYPDYPPVGDQIIDDAAVRAQSPHEPGRDAFVSTLHHNKVTDSDRWSKPTGLVLDPRSQGRRLIVADTAGSSKLKTMQLLPALAPVEPPQYYFRSVVLADPNAPNVLTVHGSPSAYSPSQTQTDGDVSSALTAATLTALANPAPLDSANLLRSSLMVKIPNNTKSVAPIALMSPSVSMMGNPNGSTEGGVFGNRDRAALINQLMPISGAQSRAASPSNAGGGGGGSGFGADAKRSSGGGGDNKSSPVDVARTLDGGAGGGSGGATPSSTVSCPGGHPREWRTADVCNWFLSFGGHLFSTYRQLINDNNIDGMVLLHDVDHPFLVECIKNTLHRNRIWREIGVLRKKWGVTPGVAATPAPANGGAGTAGSAIATLPEEPMISPPASGASSVNSAPSGTPSAATSSTTGSGGGSSLPPIHISRNM